MDCFAYMFVYALYLSDAHGCQKRTLDLQGLEFHTVICIESAENQGKVLLKNGQSS